MSHLEDEFVGATQNILKSWELFSQLVEAVTSYQHSDACRLMSETRYQLNNRYIVVTRLIDSSMMLKVADLAHAIRSAMDHIAFTFWRADSGPTNKIKRAQDVYFPVTASQQSFNQKLRDLRLHADISNLIQSVGSYHEGPGDWLYKLSALNNVGKHQQLPSADCIYNVSGIKVIRRNYEDFDNPFIEDVPEQSLTISTSQVRPYYGYPGGMAYGGLLVLHSDYRPDVDVDSSNAQIDIKVMLGRPYPVHVPLLDTLHQWLTEANAVVDNAILIARQR